MEKTVTRNGLPRTANWLILATLIAVALYFLTAWLHDDRFELWHLAIGVGLLLYVPQMIYSNQTRRNDSPEVPPPLWITASLFAGFVFFFVGVVAQWIKP